jgi:hypothetical protein
VGFVGFVKFFQSLGRSGVQQDPENHASRLPLREPAFRGAFLLLGCVC